MSEWAHEHPEEAERISHLPIPEQNRAERAAQAKWGVRREIEETFTPWHLDVYALERLWRWLVWRDLRPADPGYFISHAEEYAEEYARMLMWAGEGER